MAIDLTLASSARLAFIGLSYVYIVKFTDTLWHGFFVNPVVSFIVVSINILAGIVQLLFFYKLKSSTSSKSFFLGFAGWAGVVGALINIFPKILALSVLLQFYFSINLIKNSQIIALLSPWLGAAMLFCCCLISSLLTGKFWSGKTRYFLFGAIGYMVLTVTFSVLVLKFFSGSHVNWQEGEIGASTFYFIISATFSFLCIAYFYTGFFSGNGNIRNELTH